MKVNEMAQTTNPKASATITCAARRGPVVAAREDRHDKPVMQDQSRTRGGFDRLRARLPLEH